MHTGDYRIRSTNIENKKAGTEHRTASKMRSSTSSINPEAKLSPTGPIEIQARSMRLFLFCYFLVLIQNNKINWIISAGKQWTLASAYPNIFRNCYWVMENIITPTAYIRHAIFIAVFRPFKSDKAPYIRKPIKHKVSGKS